MLLLYGNEKQNTDLQRCSVCLYPAEMNFGISNLNSAVLWTLNFTVMTCFNVLLPRQ